MNDVAFVPFWRRLLVGLAGIVGGLAFVFGLDGSSKGPLAIPVVMLFVAAFAIHSRNLGAQLLARAVWWANLGLGAIICVLGGGSSDGMAAPVALTLLCAFALLVSGRKGLGEAGERGGYAPAAFRSSLLLLMVLALADAQTFLLFSVLLNDKNHAWQMQAILVPATVAYTVGFVGLYRLALWGAILNVATSVVVFAVCASGISPMDHELRNVLCVFSAVHVLAAAPMLIALFTGRTLPQASPRVRAILGSSVVLGIVALSMISVLGWVRLR